MEQDCSNKIVSLHLHKCDNQCPNKNVCYLNNRTSTNNLKKLTDTPIIRNILGNFKVYESICDYLQARSTELIKNYNITISSEIIDKFENKELYDIPDRVQISVYDYNIHKIYLEYPKHQKLFLIKDNYTLKFSEGLMNIVTGKLCFILEQNFLEKEMKKEGLLKFIKTFYNRFDNSQSIDSCLQSWILNGCCPYEHNYIDINYDGTVRKCPYEKEGHEIDLNKDNILNFMKQNLTPKCIYSQWLGDDNVGYNTSIQNKNTNTGIRNDLKHSRRFSLRS
jgi:hypothetical protein